MGLRAQVWEHLEMWLYPEPRSELLERGRFGDPTIRRYNFARRDPARQIRRLVAHPEKLGHGVALVPATFTALREVAT
jgi:hypothetical protein